MSAAYKVRKLRKPDTPKGSYDASSIAIPTEIAKLIDENLPEDVRFTAELTDVGILYRPVLTPEATATPENLPEWLTTSKPGKDAKGSAKSPVAAKS